MARKRSRPFPGIIYLIISNSRREARASSSHGRTIRTFIGRSVRGPSGAALDKRFLLGLNRLPRNARLMQKRTQAACVWLRLYFLRLSPRHRGPLYFTSCLHTLPEFLELSTILRGSFEYRLTLMIRSTLLCDRDEPPPDLLPFLSN